MKTDNSSKNIKLLIQALVAVSIVAMSMIGLYLKIEYSGWGLVIGGIVAINMSQE